MGFLGTLLNIIIAVWIMYFGFNGEFVLLYLSLAPIGFMLGHILRKRSKTSSIWRTEHRNIFVALVTQYIIGVILVAVFYGIGVGMEILYELRLPEGSGRI